MKRADGVAEEVLITGPIWKQINEKIGAASARSTASVGRSELPKVDLLQVGGIRDSKLHPHVART